MVRINLLPPEIVERRKYDKFYPYIFIATAILVGVIVVVWVVLQILVSQQAKTLQETKNTTAQLTAQAESLAIFEQQQQELDARQDVASEALAGRVDMGGLAEDVSLVLPEEIFSSRLKCSEISGLELDAHTPVAGLPNVKEGYKSIAACLVRLSSLEGLEDVWLTSAEVKKYSTFQPVSRTQEASGTVLSFFSTGRVVKPPVNDEGQ